MNPDLSEPILRLVVDVALVVLIWLVQLVIYPAFRSMEAAGFPAWHAAYTRTISFFAAPLMIAQAILAARRILELPGPASGLSGALVVIGWIATFGLAVPCHRELARRGRVREVVDRLVRVNWLRTAAWTLVLVGDLV